MAQRKQLNNKISESQQTDDNTEEDESSDGRDDEYEHSSLLLSKSSTRKQRWKEREFKAKPKEMTEEEMMDLALRLSEKEASDTALQHQQEEEAVMKAIQESMVVQTQPCLGSKTLLSGDSIGLGPRRKLAYSNGESLSILDQGVQKDSCTPEVDLNSDMTGSGSENMTSKKRRKRRAGSPLLEMPDLSQSQKVSSQNSPVSSESFSASLNSPQSSDSTQIDDSQVQKSPVFPLTGRRAAINIVRLDQDVVENCRSSGFYLCSQDCWTCSQKSVQPRSPTFPQTNPTSRSKSLMSSATDRGEDRQTELSPECVKSSEFGRNSPQEMSSSVCKFPDRENLAFNLSSQESLTPSVTSCFPKSPVFPQSPNSSKILPPTDGSSNSRNHDQRESKRKNERSTNPVFGMMEPQQRTNTDMQSEGLSAADLRGSNGREDIKSDGSSADELNAQPPKSEKLKEKSKHWNSTDTELTSDITLVWTDEDEDDHTPVGSPSPVFPEEGLVHEADGHAASSNHKTKEEKNRLDCSIKAQKCDPDHDKHASNSKQQQLTSTCSTEELHPISREGAACRTPPQPREPSSGPTVHYYWGVPFCPQGLDPDRYTQVILAQMEVYEKSLKQAQRCLLKKVEWGEAIHPQPEKSPSPEAPAESPQHQVPRRRGLRLRGRKMREAAQSPPSEEEERKEEEEDKEEEQQQKIVEDEKDEGDEEQMDTDDCGVCPETQLSDNDSVQDVTMVLDGGAQNSLELPSVETFLRGDSPVRDQQQGKEEEEEVAETKTEERISGCGDDATVGEEKEVKEDRSNPDVEEIQNRVFERSGSPDLEVAVVPLSPKTSVDCPLCQGSFPVSEIEMHAAYCDGEVAVVSHRRSEGDGYQESGKLRRKKMRRAERMAESVCRNQEKCYICQREVPLRDYSRHTELCLLRETSRTTAKENLLSALEQTENRDSAAGPSGSKTQPEVVIDLLDDDEEEEEEEPAAFRVSNSPIRSFTPISEATGCLIDFKKQQRAKKPSQRRR